MQMERAVQMESFRNKRTTRPSEVLHFFRSNRLERKSPFRLHNISIFTAPECSRAYTKFLRHDDLPMAWQVLRPNQENAFPLRRKISGIFQTKNFG